MLLITMETVPSSSWMLLFRSKQLERFRVSNWRLQEPMGPCRKVGRYRCLTSGTGSNRCDWRNNELDRGSPGPVPRLLACACGNLELHPINIETADHQTPTNHPHHHPIYPRTTIMAVGVTNGRHAADEEARAEVDVLNSRLEKTTQLTKKIQACLGRLDATGKSVRDVAGPLNGETKKLQILGNSALPAVSALARLTVRANRHRSRPRRHRTPAPARRQQE